jgi:hypothetical protein
MSNNLAAIYNQVSRSLELAVDSRDEKTIRSYIAFFREVIAETIAHKRINDFESYIDFPYRIYRLAAKQRNIDQPRSMENICEVLPLHLREMIVLISWNASTLENIADRSTVNAFYQLGFRSFNNLFFLQTAFHDWKLLESSINKFGQLESQFSSTGVLKANLKQLENANDNNGDQIKNLKREIQEREKFNEYKRHIVIVLKYWIYELFEHDKIPAKEANSILKALDGLRMDYKDAEDVLFLRQHDLTKYMGWDGWEYDERPEGVQINPITARDWISKGFILDRIRTGNQTFIFDKTQAESDEIRWFYDEVENIISNFLANPKRWNSILSEDQLSNIKMLTDNLLGAIGIAKRSRLSEKDNRIKDAPLSQEKIAEFTHRLGEKWIEGLRVRRIFELFGNLRDITTQDRKLMRIGPKLFLDKGKVMFLEQELYMRIYGLEDIGSQAARKEDDLFFERIFSNEVEKIFKSNIVTLLSDSIKKLRDRALEPNVILLSPEYLYLDETLLNSEKYAADYSADLNPNNINLFIIGTFDGIPLFASYSQKLKNKIVVCRFEDAFEMLYKTNNGWFKNTLSVNVREVTPQLALDKFNEQHEKWQSTDDGEPLSKEDALTLIKTAIILDVETLVDFDVKKTSNYIIGEIGR